MEKFLKYPSILHIDSEKEIQSVYEQNFDKGIFYVQEKVHGANFSFWTDGKIIKPAKRTDFLKPDEKFFNFQKIIKKYNNQVLGLFDGLKSQIADIKFIIIYGELFGGIYLHPDVKPVAGAISVQGGLFYCPDNEFYAFDISINGDYFLDVSQINSLFEKWNFIYAKTLFQGSFKKALSHSNEFESTIPEIFGLPKIENNICEGIVIRPEKSIFIDNHTRLIIKNKNAKWAEEVQISKKDVIDEYKNKITKNLQNRIVNFVTKNRLENVISKMGKDNEIWQFKVALIDDAFDDFLKKFENEYNSLSNNKKKLIKITLNKKASELINSYFNPNIPLQ